MTDIDKYGIPLAKDYRKVRDSKATVEQLTEIGKLLSTHCGSPIRTNLPLTKVTIDYLVKRGYKVTASTITVGYGMDERDVPGYYIE